VEGALVFGTGFVGAAIAVALGERGTVTSLDIDTHPALARRDDEARTIVESALDETGADIVVNASGRLRGTDDEMNQANVAWPTWLIDVLADRKVRFVHLGSASEYGAPPSDAPLGETDEINPQGIYGESKWAGSRTVLAARDEGMNATVARGFNLVGAHLAPVSPLHQFLTDVNNLPAEGGEIELWWPATVRDFILLDDLAEGVARLALLDDPPPIMNMCSGIGVSFGDIVTAMAAAQNKSVTITSLDKPGIETVIGDSSLLRSLTGLDPQMSAELIAERAGI
jgi:nucleoside-diphosphate-sugar epimerase